MRPFLLPGIFLLIAATAHLAAQSQAGLEAALDSLVQTELEQKRIPSIAIGVVRDGTAYLAKAYGWQDVDSRTPASASTVYQLGSVTKMFTGHLLAHLIHQGKIQLDDPLATHLPASVDVPETPTGEAVTLRHLATHSADFPRYPANLERVDPDPIRGYTLDQMLTGIGLVEIDTTPGVQYQYSNFGYGVLGTMMEYATQHDLNTLMQDHIFEPLGMTDSGLSPNSAMQQRLATPYLEVAPYLITEPWDMGTLSGAGNLFSTVNDLNKFMLALLTDDDVNAIQQQSYLRINDAWSYGLGCFIIESESKNTRIIYHGGDIDGYASSLTIYPEFGLGYVILTNWGEGQTIGETFTRIDRLITAKLLR